MIWFSVCKCSVYDVLLLPQACHAESKLVEMASSVSVVNVAVGFASRVMKDALRT